MLARVVGVPHNHLQEQATAAKRFQGNEALCVSDRGACLIFCTHTVNDFGQVESALDSNASPVEAVMTGLQQIMVNWQQRAMQQTTC